MNYYPFHLGDYAAHTAHLEPIEDLAYRRMLDLYYRTERPLPEPAEIARLIRLRDHAATIRDVLHEFFQPSPEGYRHARCDEEIERMQDKQAKARASAAASVNARSTNAQRTLNERSTNAELPTPTPTPTPIKTNTPRKSADHSPAFAMFWSAYPNKEAKAGAAKAFDKLAPSTDLLDEILAAIAAQRGWPKWTEEGGKYIPHAATWINGRRWEDALPLLPKYRHETPRQAAAIDRVIEMSGGLLNARRTQPQQPQQPEYIDAIENFPALG